ncbi:TPA: hypothetical protein JIP97_001669 [Acinetobacter baumannii]|nr:hypothetical protein [Acinetobacter baumannii]
MNSQSFNTLSSKFFLNGVCRHELKAMVEALKGEFLNGVCRHEPNPSAYPQNGHFLNGVCRHERDVAFQRSVFRVSKWRMPP